MFWAAPDAADRCQFNIPGEKVWSGSLLPTNARDPRKKDTLARAYGPEQTAIGAAPQRVRNAAVAGQDQQESLLLLTCLFDQSHKA